jgi:hypothetical protein
MLINILIIFFIILILCQLFSYNIEGMETSNGEEYIPYRKNDPNNVLILAQQNAGNIEVLKQQIDKVLGLNQEVQDISNNLATLTSQVTNLMAAQQQYAQANIPSPTPQITGSE